MPKLAFNRVQAGQPVRADDLNGNYQIAEAALNNLDQSNWASGKIFPLDKLKQANANTNDIMYRGSSTWGPVSPSTIRSSLFPAWTSFTPQAFNTDGSSASGWLDMGSSYLRVGHLVLATIRMARSANGSISAQTISLPVEGTGKVLGSGWVERDGGNVQNVVAVLSSANRVGVTWDGGSGVGVIGAFGQIIGIFPNTGSIILNLMYQAA